MNRVSHIDPNGRLMTFCAVAGCNNQPACFGIGVSMMRGKIGKWYCGDHRPCEAGRGRPPDGVAGKARQGAGSGEIIQGRLF